VLAVTHSKAEYYLKLGWQFISESYFVLFLEMLLKPNSNKSNALTKGKEKSGFGGC
jgi:hypothetical protein